MDNAHADATTSSERRRAIEPILFFAGVLLAVAAAIALVTWEAFHAPIGPRAEPAGEAHGH